MIINKSAISRRAVLKGGVFAAAGIATAIHAPAILAQDRRVSIMVLGANQLATAWLQEALAEFTAQTGNQVELRQSDWGSAFQKLLTATASGTLPDVTMIGQVMTPALASRGAFLAIDDKLSNWSDTGLFYPAMLRDGTYDGKSYAVPIYADVRTAVYRADLLSQVGVGTDALPSDWDQFKALAVKLSKANGGPLDSPFFGQNDKAVGLTQIFAQMLYQANGAFFDQTGKASLSNPAGVRTLEYFVSFFKEGLANANIVYQGAGASPLVQGSAAMAYDGVSIVSNAEQFNPDALPQLFAGKPLTADAGGDPKTIAWINKLAISAKTTNPDGAWELVSFLTSKQNSEKIAEFWGGLPARTDQADAPYLADVPAGFVTATQYAGAMPTSANLLQIQQQINVAMQSAIRRVAAPADILADLDRKIDELNGL